MALVEIFWNSWQVKDIHVEVLAEFAAWDGIRDDAEADYRNRRIDNGAAYRRQWKADARIKRKVIAAKAKPIHCAHCAAPLQLKARGVRLYCNVRCRTVASCKALVVAANASPLRSQRSIQMTEAYARRKAA